MIYVPFIRIPWKDAIVFNSHCKTEIFRVSEREAKRSFVPFLLVHKLIFLVYNLVLRQAKFHFSAQGIRQWEELMQTSFLGKESLVFGILSFAWPGLGWHLHTGSHVWPHRSTEMKKKSLRKLTLGSDSKLHRFLFQAELSNIICTLHWTVNNLVYALGHEIYPCHIPVNTS